MSKEMYAMVAAVWKEVIDMSAYGGTMLQEYVKSLKSSCLIDAETALDRIVQEAVKEERQRICKVLCDMGEAELQVNNSNDAQLLYHAARKVAALKGGEA